MPFEFRCPVHGFIEVDEWEREIIAHSAFQRLRRIRQLGWTDYVYPGAMHMRFEHSLGVMHVATRLFEAICTRSATVLREVFSYNSDMPQRHRRIVRLAALLHDVGHCPFSHAPEDVLPVKQGDKRYTHEDYSAAIIRGPMREVIENHEINKNNDDIRAEEVAGFLEGSTKTAGLLFWRELITGQMDADRMDYLLRDSYHLGVQYGKYDIDRLINTICAVPGNGEEAPRVGVQEGGWHAAESLVLARYYMFTQVYFHKTRVAYDYYIREALRSLLPKGTFGKPTPAGLEAYLKWDDWRVLGRIAAGNGGEHGRRLATRNHYRMAYSTIEHPGKEELARLADARVALGRVLQYETTASKSWYKVDKSDVPVAMKHGGSKMLSELSLPVANIGEQDQSLLYVDFADVGRAKERLRDLGT